MRAFSLVELSIVLVILGLLTGGILAGQSLIRAAELRSISADHNRYISAINTFRDKYMALPGDMLKATDFWLTAGTCPGTSASPSTTATTCNGNGNGLIEYSTTTSNEQFRLWQHLANAGLIEGTYSGVSNSTTAATENSRLDFNIPRSKISNAGWHIRYWANVAISDMNYYEGNYGNAMHFGLTNGSMPAYGAILRPEEAWNLDVKMDDGKPATGKIVTMESMGGTCADLAASNSASQSAAEYLLSNSSIACSLIFKL